VNDAHSPFQTIAERLSRVIGAADDVTLDLAATTCLEELGGFADVDTAFITLVDDAACVTDDWRWIRPSLAGEALPVGTPFPETVGSAMESLRVGTTVVTDDLTECGPERLERVLGGVGDLRATILVPVIVGSTLRGVMGMALVEEPRQWDRTLVGQVEFLAQTLVQAACRTRQQRALAVANARASRIAAYIPDGLLLVSLKGNVAWVSPSFCSMSGLAAGQILNQPALSFFHPSGHQALEDEMARALVGHDAQISVQFQSGPEEWRWADVALRLATDPESLVPNEIVMSVRDAHERHLREQHLVRQADQDLLTGLANRAAFERAVADLAEREVRVLVAFCDIDDFKTINDRFGHDVGDEALRAVASAIAGVVRGQDIVARFGGDEFAVVAIVEDGCVEFPLGPRLVGATRGLAVQGTPISLSVGICGPGPATNTAAMRQMADQAMYTVKHNDKNDWIQVAWGPANS